MSTTVKKVGKMSVKIVSKDAALACDEMISASDAEMDNRAMAAVRSAIDKAKICKKPIARYDTATKRAYVEYANGEKKYVK